MKTMKQVADEIGVTKDALRKRISREPLKSNIEPNTEIKDGTKYINSAGVDVIKKAYLSVADNPTDVPTTNRINPNKKDMDNPTDIPTDVLRLIDNLRTDHKAELEVKNKQIEELNARLAEVTELANISQRLHAGTLQQQLIGSPPIEGETAPADERECEAPAPEEPLVEPSKDANEIADLRLQRKTDKAHIAQLQNALAQFKSAPAPKRGLFGLFGRKT
jgi:hypothetical protein